MWKHNTVDPVDVESAPESKTTQKSPWEKISFSVTFRAAFPCDSHWKPVNCSQEIAFGAERKMPACWLEVARTICWSVMVVKKICLKGRSNVTGMTVFEWVSLSEGKLFGKLKNALGLHVARIGEAICLHPECPSVLVCITNEAKHTSTEIRMNWTWVYMECKGAMRTPSRRALKRSHTWCVCRPEPTSF